MRFPVGMRETLAGAFEAATESAQLTKMRYRVHITGWRRPQGAMFHFSPADPDNMHPEFTAGVMM